MLDNPFARVLIVCAWLRCRWRAFDKLRAQPFASRPIGDPASRNAEPAEEIPSRAEPIARAVLIVDAHHLLAAPNADAV